jgi:hypothetical protein
MKRKFDTGTLGTSSSGTVNSEDDLDVKFKIRNQIQAGINRRDDKFLAGFYQRKIEGFGVSALSQEQFTSVLEELGVYWKNEDIQTLFRSMDASSDCHMDLENFKRAIQTPSTLEQLMSTLPIHLILADAIPEIQGFDRLRLFSQITPEQIDDIIREAIPFLNTVLKEAADKTRIALESKDKSKVNPSASKFEVPAEMSAGTVKDFHGGLTSRIGRKETPLLFRVFILLRFTKNPPFVSHALPHLPDLQLVPLPRRHCCRELVGCSNVGALQEPRQRRALPDPELQHHHHPRPRVGYHDAAK